MNTQPTADASRHAPTCDLPLMAKKAIYRRDYDDQPAYGLCAVHESDRFGSRIFVIERSSIEEAQALADLIVEAVNAHARLTRQADAAKGLRDQLEAVAAELRLRPTDPRSYSMDSYLPQQMRDPILATLAAYEKACADPVASPGTPESP